MRNWILCVSLLVAFPVMSDYPNVNQVVPLNPDELSPSLTYSPNPNANATSAPAPNTNEGPTSTTVTQTTTPTSSTTTTTTTSTPKPPPETPEDRAFKQQMIVISNAIEHKIAQIQAKETEIENEIYMAYVPPLVAERRALEQELRNLEMQRDQMQSQKTANDLRKQLGKPKGQ